MPLPLALCLVMGTPLGCGLNHRFLTPAVPAPDMHETCLLAQGVLAIVYEFPDWYRWCAGSYDCVDLKVRLHDCTP